MAHLYIQNLRKVPLMERIKKLKAYAEERMSGVGHPDKLVHVEGIVSTVREINKIYAESVN